MKGMRILGGWWSLIQRVLSMTGALSNYNLHKMTQVMIRHWRRAKGVVSDFGFALQYSTYLTKNPHLTNIKICDISFSLSF